jgi:ribosomal protein S6--L-glutamate ligase
VLHGNQGNGVALLKNQADFDAFVAEYNEEGYFVQDFVEQATGHDKRLLIAGGKLIGAMERHSTTDDFRANLHQGGQATAYTPTEREVELAQLAANAFGVDFVGVDIIDSIDGPLVLEVNPSPGLKIGEIIGVDIAEKIIKELFHD